MFDNYQRRPEPLSRAVCPVCARTLVSAASSDVCPHCGRRRYVAGQCERCGGTTVAGFCGTCASPCQPR